jgi:hypothetical protein
VSPGEFYEAVLAFLDQFIARGAAPDVRGLRQRLGSDPEARRLLEDHLPTQQPSEREAFDAMTAFFAAEWERGGRVDRAAGRPNLIELISWTSWDLSGDPADPVTQATADPAQWHDWLASVQATRRQ